MYEVSAQYVPWGEKGTDEGYWQWFVVKFLKMNKGSCTEEVSVYVADIYMSLLSGALPGDV